MGARGEHVPWVKVQKGHEEVYAYGRAGGDDQIGEYIVAEVEGGGWIFELDNDDVHGCEDGVEHDYGVYDETGHVHLLGSKRKVSHKTRG